MMNNTRNKFFSAAITSLLLLGGVAVFNILIDPYWLWTTSPRWVEKSKGDNRILDKKMRFIKPLQCFVRKPRIVVMGSSKVYRGIDVSDIGDDAYNFGVSSLTIWESKVYIHFLHRYTDAEVIVLGLDYFMFNENKKYRSGFNHNTGSIGQLMIDLIASTVSFDSLVDSRAVLKAKSKKRYDGFWTNYGYKRTENRSAAVIENIIKGHKKRYPDMRLSREGLDALEEIIVMCKSNSISLVLYISPYSKRQYEILNQDYVNRVNRDIELVSKVYEIPFYNLAQNHPYVDAELSGGSSNYWIDYNHYSSKVGAYILEQFNVGIGEAK